MAINPMNPMDLSDLSLVVRALHQDVSALDDRIRRLEAMVRELHGLRDEHAADLRVLPSADFRTFG